MISIIDYQMGNLLSVQKGFERVGHSAQITDDVGLIAESEKLVLPGVGAFGDAMSELSRRKLIDPICAAIESGTPFLGICLGLQLLFEYSEEGGRHDGLGILPGKVVRFELDAPFKVPHMGWNQAQIRRPSPILDGIPEGTHFYFVHSYFVVPEDEQVVSVETDYGASFCAMVSRDNLFATQFHPEKSQTDGLRILKNFSELR